MKERILHTFPMKERKLLLVGPPGSGKISLLHSRVSIIFILISLRLRCGEKISSTDFIVFSECYNSWLFSFLFRF